jgi:hypothetical protein
MLGASKDPPRARGVRVSYRPDRRRRPTRMLSHVVSRSHCIIERARTCDLETHFLGHANIQAQGPVCWCGPSSCAQTPIPAEVDLQARKALRPIHAPTLHSPYFGVGRRPS